MKAYENHDEICQNEFALIGSLAHHRNNEYPSFDEEAFDTFFYRHHTGDCCLKGKPGKYSITFVKRNGEEIPCYIFYYGSWHWAGYYGGDIVSIDDWENNLQIRNLIKKRYKEKVGKEID